MASVCCIATRVSRLGFGIWRSVVVVVCVWCRTSVGSVRRSLCGILSMMMAVHCFVFAPAGVLGLDCTCCVLRVPAVVDKETG